jgi:2-phospho-L-lactate guanylyltransferase
VTEPWVDLLVPVKPLAMAKTRLRGANPADPADPAGPADPVDPARHERLVLALARDTVAAARAVPSVRRTVLVSSDPRVAEALEGIPVLPDRPGLGLNAALRHAAELVRARWPGAALGALQADLPALRAEELADALAVARRLFSAGANRVFCADAQGEGTTLLVCAPGAPLDPRFGFGSARRHERAGARPLPGEWPGLRRDVDTRADLRRAAQLGLGPATRDALDTIVDGCR